MRIVVFIFLQLGIKPNCKYHIKIASISWASNKTSHVGNLVESRYQSLQSAKFNNNTCILTFPMKFVVTCVKISWTTGFTIGTEKWQRLLDLSQLRGEGPRKMSMREDRLKRWEEVPVAAPIVDWICFKMWSSWKREIKDLLNFKNQFIWSLTDLKYWLVKKTEYVYQCPGKSPIYSIIRAGPKVRKIRSQYAVIFRVWSLCTLTSL